tara:strand:- start:1549 stop:1923 length:375 start_codon:yes stop_codon:yes gene_type:complete
MLMNVNIDLTANKSNKLNESFVVQWAADVKYVLGHLLSPGLYPSLMEQEEDTANQPEPQSKKITIKGTKEDLEAFASVMNKEKEYATQYMEHGLGSPELTDSKLNLEKSIHNFEKSTGLIWPLR